jgi:hypothetical protein
MTTTQLDHLVFAATTLEAGVHWCETTLGVTPGPGGEHPLFGTHNRLLKLNRPAAPNAYLEIIAINPLSTPTRPAPLKRWFDLDEPALQESLRLGGPQLIHWVASVPNIETVLTAWRALGIERGPALTASRDTPRGRLEWAITVRDDGQRLFDGCLPSLIQWGTQHPAHSLPDSGLELVQMDLHHPQADRLERALQAAGLTDFKTQVGPARMRASLQTPLGASTGLTPRPQP